ncbi:MULTISPECIES: 1-acyl-sn-glycerol-3-phosphate acyltransferase [unclassified Saccharopolyspora]|uniref:lysophospholipid acyltransferase family protein n=1 Tax=unclassified Saccharopolyspora TaxID=2646250 RepID=UPI001CD670B4|nr:MULTISPECIES: lysophospholipid acyltransferase family protein [unclassified Saccharopolyspora]MCA1186090.1 1-acyl-sn-glycerol-3-phosphate acyltransferase [Saccharopolyspora sp. 6T]MCA1224545.1 1-acyl-sn-glycerol-3-phosphate acyltransferase [Saccharopolyspora sp. 6M]MCA1279016.1 1-acyl-sn-glycerol-3-phosphate acyltransferase [Saccharopolyspora sp. 7B]
MLYMLTKRVLGSVARAVYRPKVTGAEQVPAEGPVIFAVNHLSVADSFIVPLVVPRPVAFLAKAEYFQGGGVKNRLVGGVFRSLGAIPVERGRGRAAKEALGAAERVLADGGAFGIHPEGTRSPDGRLYRGRTGVARLALSGAAKVVPVALHGTDRLLPIGAKVPRLTRVEVRFGAPLDFSRYHGMEGSLPVLRSITDEIMYAISELSDQEYVDRYQSPSSQQAA